MKTRICLLLLGAWCGAGILGAAEPASPPDKSSAPPVDPMAAAEAVLGSKAPTPAPAPTNAPAEAALPPRKTAPPVAPPGQKAPPPRVVAVRVPAVASPPPPPAARGVTNSEPTGVVLNFKGAPLSDVLNYLSEAAGFVVVQETEVSGTVNVISHQPLSPDEAVDLLNTILVDQGYTAIRSGRILKIVSLENAAKKLLPVRTGSDPATIPAKDELVTQIIPVSYADATKLIENLKPLLPENAQITANESSNAIVLTDTLASIRRMAEIIHALDTSIAGISTVKVFPLQYSDASELAKVITELFKTESSGSRRSSGLPPWVRGRDGGSRNAKSSSEARQAAVRVVAVADERTNSLIVSAPDAVMPIIEEIVHEVDTSVTDLTELRIFRLEYADATETADLLMQLFSEDYTTSSRSSRSGFRPPFMMFPGMRSSGRSSKNNRRLEQTRVVAVGDPRTNSLLVSAPHDLMTSIAEMIGRLDADSSKRQRVYVYPLEHADVENVAAILESMFQNSSNTRRNNSRNRNNTTSALSNRQSRGASINPSLGGRNSGGPSNRSR